MRPFPPVPAQLDTVTNVSDQTLQLDVTGKTQIAAITFYNAVDFLPVSISHR